VLDARTLTLPADGAPQTVRTAGIAGLGSALPGAVVPNSEVAEWLGVDDRWIERRTGIRSRRMLADGERLSDIATAAGRAALDDAGLDAAAIDLVLVATLAADEITPGTAPLVAEALGIRSAAIDVNAACVGFLSALDLACSRVEAGRAEHVLVIGAEALSRFVDRGDRRVAPLFGDGAGAAVVSPGAGALAPVVLRSDGSLCHLIVATREDPFIRMEGHETFLRATAALSEATVDACAAAGVGLDDIDVFVFHQANRRILDAVAERLGLERGRVVDAIADLANTSAASIPLALCAARDEGRLAPGRRVLLGAMGAGFVYGAGVLTWA
jgi:3-oxoacyl-[acyl-carrier-protein] synthase III